MTIESKLTELVRIYARFDPEKNAYIAKSDDKSFLLELDADLSQLINQQLLIDGPEEAKLTQNYKRISRYFHPDKAASFLPEVIWLEEHLGEKPGDGICFKTLSISYEKLMNPHKYKEINFENIKNREDCKIWLQGLRNQAGTYTGRSFCDSLIGLLDESGGFFDATGAIKPQGLKTLITFLPMIFASYGAILFARELFAVYALFFLMLKGGQYMEYSNLTEVKAIGQALQDISIISASATTTLMVRLLEMTFWISHQCLDMSLQIGSSVLKPFSSLPVDNNDHAHGADFCRDLIRASNNLNAGMQFKTPELKVISAPLEAYLGLNSQQFFGDWRLGRTKRLQVEAFLFRMNLLDGSTRSTEEKLIEAKKELEHLKNNKSVYTAGSKTAEAVDNSERVMTVLMAPDPANTQIIAYSGNGG